MHLAIGNEGANVAGGPQVVAHTGVGPNASFIARASEAFISRRSSVHQADWTLGSYIVVRDDPSFRTTSAARRIDAVQRSCRDSLRWAGVLPLYVSEAGDGRLWPVTEELQCRRDEDRPRLVVIGLAAAARTCC